MHAKAFIQGYVGKVAKTKSGRTKFSVGVGRDSNLRWYTVIGDVPPPSKGDKVSVTGDLALGEPYNGRSMATIFLSDGLDVHKKETEDLDW